MLGLYVYVLLQHLSFFLQISVSVLTFFLQETYFGKQSPSSQPLKYIN